MFSRFGEPPRHAPHPIKLAASAMPFIGAIGASVRHRLRVAPKTSSTNNWRGGVGGTIWVLDSGQMLIPDRHSRSPGVIIGVIAGTALLVALALLVVSVATNFEVGRSFGRTDAEQLLYGAACGCADGLKALLFTLSAATFRNGRRTMSITGFALFGLLTVFSFTSTVGFGLTSRTYAGDVQVLQAEQNRSTITSLRDDQRELDRVRARLREHDLPVRERRQLERRNEELAAAVADRQRRLALAPRIVTATTQSDILARMLGVAPETVTLGLAILLALSMDLGPGIGLTVAMEMLGNAHPRRRSAPKIRTPKGPPPQAPNLRVAASRATLQPKSRAAPGRSDIERSVSNFLHERTVKGGTVDATQLFQAYQARRSDLGMQPVSQRAFGDTMRHLGYHKDRRTTSGRFQYLGITLILERRAAA